MSSYSLAQLQAIVDAEFKSKAKEEAIALDENISIEKAKDPIETIFDPLLNWPGDAPIISVPLLDSTYIKMECLKMCMAGFHERYSAEKWEFLSKDQQEKVINDIFETAQYLINRFKTLK